MKKIFITLLLLVTLGVSAMAFNAPLTAAEFVANESYASLEHASDADMYKNGTLQIEKTTSVLVEKSDAQGNVYYKVVDGREINYMPISIPADAFDIVVKYALYEEPTAVAGYVLNLFINPEILEFVLTREQNVYNGGLYDLQKVAITVPNALLPDMTLLEPQGPFAKAHEEGTPEAEKERLLVAYANTSKDGVVSVSAAASSDLDFDRLRGKELARFTFAEKDTANNNWYRTKISLDFDKNGFFDASNNSYAPVVDGPVYYYNPDYTGPKFDIIGGMKKADGALRFGSVYFLGDEYFDNQAEILEAGVVCYPSELLEDKVLTIQTEGALRIPATGYQSLDREKGEMTYTGVITGLPEDMYITAKSYITYIDKNGNEVTVYSDPIARKLATADTAEMK